VQELANGEHQAHHGFLQTSGQSFSGIDCGSARNNMPSLFEFGGVKMNLRKLYGSNEKELPTRR